PLRAGEPVHLLLSKGPTQNVLTMPSIVGLSVEDAMTLLAPMGVQVTANRIDNPNAEPNRVLSQTPAPGTLLQEGQSVTYDVRASGESPLPNSMRKVEVVYTVPGAWSPREVRIDVIDRRGTRQTVLPTQEQYRAGERPKYEPNTKLRLPLSFNDELTVEIYVDGQRACTYYYEGDKPPVITDHLDQEGQEEGVAQT
ncbi:MAG TPA: PASTA domain-containing protein, partial [Candidatus Hydrogenedentes bacterium]|nr:PASTA domain-containing protein [Candidatus Hydrogenedentota bacterium]